MSASSTDRAAMGGTFFEVLDGGPFVIADGAMGTNLMARGLEAGDAHRALRRVSKRSNPRSVRCNGRRKRAQASARACTDFDRRLPPGLTIL